MTLTVTTWNLQGSHGVDVEAVAAYLREVGCDVAALQEVQRHQLRAIARALDARSSRWAFKHWPVRTRPEGMAVVGITRPVRRVRARSLTRRWNPLSWRRRIYQVGHTVMPADPSGRGPGATRVTVVNMHLSPHRDAADDRARELRTVLGRVPAVTAGTAVIVAGDLNARPGTALMDQLRQAGFTAPEVGPTNWSGDPADRPADQQLDYVWASPALAVEAAVLPAHGDDGYDRFPRVSDHLPLTVTVVRAAGGDEVTR